MPRELPVQAGDVRRIVEHLASYPTRHTLSRYNREAAEWIAEQYRAIPGMQVEIMTYVAPEGPRVPKDTEVYQVIATLPGQYDRRVILGGHFDSLNLVGTDGPGDFDRVINNPAPGANDDASGVAVGLSAAAIAPQKPLNTLVFVAFSGEEQGLLGAKALSLRAKEEDWDVLAMLNYDMVGSSRNRAGDHDPHHIRVFSEESAHHQSRELARILEWHSRDQEVKPKLVFRKDRYGRGGDHSPFNAQGFTAVRFVECHEEYAHQHTPEDLPENMDFDYLAGVATLTGHLLGLLSASGPQPSNVRVTRAPGRKTLVEWDGDGPCQIYWRETTSPTWEHAQQEQGGRALIEADIDDHIFGVGAYPAGIPLIAQ